MIKIGNGKLSGMEYDGKGDGIKYLTACGIKNAHATLSEKKNGVGYSAKYNSEKIAGNQNEIGRNHTEGNRIGNVVKSTDYEICTIDLKVLEWNRDEWNEAEKEIQHTRL